jgi:signal transduction histidine kinase
MIPRHLTRRHARKVDVALAALLTLGALLSIALGGDAGRHRLAAALMAGVTVAPIAVRRRWPLLVGAGVPALAAVDHKYFDPQFVGYPIATFCAMYALAAWTRPRAFVGGLVVFAAANVAVPGSFDRVGLLWTLVSIATMLLVRHVVVGRERRAQLAERERDLAAREAVVEERARIARELHDTVAHHLSIMIIQAGAERRALNGAGGSTGRMLGSIEELGRGSLAELRRMLGLLRSEHASDALSEAARGR